MEPNQPEAERSNDLLLAVFFVGVICAIGALIGNVLLAGAFGSAITIGIIEAGAWFSRRR